MSHNITRRQQARSTVLERKLPYLSKNIILHSLQIKLVSVASRRRKQQIGQSLSFSVETETVKGILLSLAESIACCINLTFSSMRCLDVTSKGGGYGPQPIRSEYSVVISVDDHVISVDDQKC